MSIYLFQFHSKQLLSTILHANAMLCIPFFNSLFSTLAYHSHSRDISMCQSRDHAKQNSKKLHHGHKPQQSVHTAWRWRRHAHTVGGGGDQMIIFLSSG